MSVTVPDAERLLRRVAKGDVAAFDELYRRTAPAVAVRLRRRCSDDGLVAEVLQDTYLTVWRAAGSFADLPLRGGGAAGWLWTIAARRLVDALRRQARRVETPAAELPAVGAPAAEDEALAGAVGGEIGDALGRLAPELRAVLRALVLDGLTVRETSDPVALGAAGAWLMGVDVLPHRPYDAGVRAQIAATVRELRALPGEEQVRRVTALRDAAGACRTDDLRSVLTGGPAA